MDAIDRYKSELESASLDETSDRCFQLTDEMLRQYKLLIAGFGDRFADCTHNGANGLVLLGHDMHRLIGSTPPENDDELRQYLTDKGVDPDQFTRAMNGVAQHIARQVLLVLDQDGK